MREGVTLTIARHRKRITAHLMTLDTALRNAAGDEATYQRHLAQVATKLRTEVEVLTRELGEVPR